MSAGPSSFLLPSYHHHVNDDALHDRYTTWQVILARIGNMTMTMMTMTMRYATTTIYTLLAFSLASSSPLVVYAAPNANANFNADVGKTLLEVLSAPIVWSDVVGAGLVTRQDTTTPNTPAACVAVCDPINPIVSAVRPSFPSLSWREV